MSDAEPAAVRVGSDRDVQWLVPGRASAPIVVLDEPLSFWGGFDPETGTVIDRRHPQAGAELAGRVVVMPAGRGSSSASSVIAEAVRSGTAPAAIVMADVDEIVALGAIVADELYGIAMPVLAVGEATYRRLAAATHAELH